MIIFEATPTEQVEKVSETTMRVFNSLNKEIDELSEENDKMAEGIADVWDDVRRLRSYIDKGEIKDMEVVSAALQMIMFRLDHIC